MAKRFNIPFRSLGNVSCRIEIWDIDYSGSVVELSESNPNAPGLPAADPIYIEEDSSEDLLQPLRPKTGYINLIEMTTGGLSVLRPLTSNKLSVRFYYNSELVFIGYVQAQSFGDELMQAPREMKIPICSPLALMRGKTFVVDDELIDKKLGYYLDECLSVYGSSIFPLAVTESLDSGVYHPLQLRIDSRLVCPWNSDYDFGVTDTPGTTPSPYAPIAYEDFLVGFCNLFGLIAHEYGETIIFSKYNYDGQYVRFNRNEYQEDSYDDAGTGGDDDEDNINVSNTFTPGGVDNTGGVVLPVRGVRVDFGSFVDSIDMDLTRSVDVGYLTTPINGVVLDKRTNELSSTLYSSASGDLENVNHVRIVGDNGTTGMLDIRAVLPDHDTLMLSYVFTSVPGVINGAEITSTFASNSTVRMQVYSGGKYFHPYDSDVWQSTPEFIPLTFDADGFCTTIMGTNGNTVEIRLFPGSSGVAHGIIKSFTLTAFSNPLRRYSLSTRNFLYQKGTSGAVDDSEVTMMFHNYSGNSGKVYGGTVMAPNYAYKLKPQPRQRLEVKVASGVDMETLYLKKLTADGMSVYSRLVATEFHPWDDLYTLYIQGSDTL